MESAIPAPRFVEWVVWLEMENSFSSVIVESGAVVLGRYG
jgi:hypothetical protein